MLRGLVQEPGSELKVKVELMLREKMMRVSHAYKKPSNAHHMLEFLSQEPGADIESSII